jgi:hypothetical protein
VRGLTPVRALQGCNQQEGHGNEQEDGHGSNYALNNFAPLVAELSRYSKFLPYWWHA